MIEPGTADVIAYKNVPSNDKLASVGCIPYMIKSCANFTADTATFQMRALGGTANTCAATQDDYL